MSRQIVALTAIPIGILLLIVSYSWPESGLTSGWTDAKSLAHQQESAKLHQMTYAAAEQPGKNKGPHAGHDHSHGDGPVSASELDEQKKKVKAGQAELDAARTGGVFWARILWGLGMLVTGGGAAAMYLLPPQPDEKRK